MTGAGALFYSVTTSRFLFLLRNNTKTRGTWGMAGGKLNVNENIIDGLRRELTEELGPLPPIIKHIPLETFTSMDEQFRYHSFIFTVQNEFIPTLNNEHSGYAWAEIEKYPKPLHPGIFHTINIDVIKEKLQQIKTIFS